MTWANCQRTEGTKDCDCCIRTLKFFLHVGLGLFAKWEVHRTYITYVHAKSCLILCDPMDCSPPGSSVHGLLQARIPEWCPPSGDLPDPATEPDLPQCRQILYHLSHQGNSLKKGRKILKKNKRRRRKRSLSCVCTLRQLIALHFKMLFM